MGKKDVLATGLKADTDYTVVVFSYQNKEVGAVVKKTVRTQKEGEEPTPGDFKIEITVTDITHNSAKVKVTPSDDTVDYYVNVFPKSEVERDGKMLEGWEFIEYYGQDPYIGYKTHKGVYERSLSGLSSSYSYVVAAYDLSQDEEVPDDQGSGLSRPVPDYEHPAYDYGGDLYRDTPECGRMVLHLDYDEIYL